MRESRTLLVIDDESLVRFSLTAYLEDSGYTCVEAMDGIEGLQIFDETRPDLVITDLRMPRLDGLGFISALRERSPDTPVIVLSGTGESEIGQQAVSQGARACLFKPLYDMTMLTDTIRSILGPTDLEGGSA